MAYTELIKNFEKIRDYMREFYIYGFRSREQIQLKSLRSYDNEKRRIESYLKDYMGFRMTPAGKQVFISIDSRDTHHNPLYQALKAKSFTNMDITLHFILLDILYDCHQKKTLKEMLDIMDAQYLHAFSHAPYPDASTIRKKLNEYLQLGLIRTEKSGKQLLYSRNETVDLHTFHPALHFFSEAACCGIIGSNLLDLENSQESFFKFKHHHIFCALDSEILCQIFEAMQQQSVISISLHTRKGNDLKDIHVLPLKMMISAENGRHHLLACHPQTRQLSSYRLDAIKKVKCLFKDENYQAERLHLDTRLAHVWGVSLKNERMLEHVSLTIHYEDDEPYILQRLFREKRCGQITLTDKNTIQFEADVEDSNELLPWIRTLIGRITHYEFTNAKVQKQFETDLQAMYKLYQIGGD